MIIVSEMLNSYFRYKLRSKTYRIEAFKKVINKELRKSKLGKVLLRNVYEQMTSQPSLQEELIELIGDKDYQKVYWESDLGYFLLEGTYNVNHTYFKMTLDSIKKNNYTSHLDVGCGWGELSMLVSKNTKAAKVDGIDIVKELIDEATARNGGEVKPKFYFLDVMDVKEQYDIVTLFGPPDYIDPKIFPAILEKLLQIAKKEILLFNSLRGQPFEKILETKEAIEIRRYDIGYLQPINHLLTQFQSKYSFSYKIERHSSDSAMAVITMNPKA